MKKISKLERIKNSFHFKDGKLDLSSYGQFKGGLTSEEINNYLIARANTLNIKRLRKKFNEIAGVNTCTSYTCPKCGVCKSLMYRHDILRFVNVLFEGKSTFFD